MDSKSFQTMRLSGLLCDCTIQIVDKQLPVHGVVMASRCDYFRGLLQSGMQDANRVDLSNMPGNYDTMKSIVDFCYGISIQDRLDESNIAHVLCAASYLQMSGHNNLEEICGDKLKKLTKHKLTRCLTILYNCTDIGVVAEREGVTEKCMEAAVHLFKSYDEDKSGPTDKLCKSLNLGNLPIPWMKQILEKMQQSGCDMSTITSVSTGFVQARRRSLTSSIFVRVVQSTDWCSRESFDAPFEALSEMLEIPQDVMQITEMRLQTWLQKLILQS